jgi:hypothetical protein
MTLPPELGREIVARLNEKDNRIRAEELIDLGYDIYSRALFIAIGSNTERDMAIFEVRNPNKTKTGFCYLFIASESKGIILNHPFSEYEKYLGKN